MIKYRILAKLIVLFTISTLSFTLWPINSPNAIVGAAIAVSLLYITLTSLTTEGVFILLLCALLSMTSIFFARDQFLNLDSLTLWLVTTLFLYNLGREEFIDNLRSAFLSSRRLILFTIVICNILLIVSFFNAGSYVETYRGTIFRGFTIHAHTLASSVCLLLALTFFVLRNLKPRVYHLLFFIPGVYAILESGARVFILSFMAILVLYYHYSYRKVPIKMFLLPVGAAVLFYVVMNSGMVERIRFSLEHTIHVDPLTRFMSGRNVFWIISLEAFSNFGVINTLFGNGFDYEFYVNLTGFGAAIWAHNDIISLLLSVGIIGTCFYVFVVWKALRSIHKIANRKLLTLLIASYVIVAILFSGLYIYQHYLFSFVILAVSLMKKPSLENIKDNEVSFLHNTRLDSIDENSLRKV